MTETVSTELPSFSARDLPADMSADDAYSNRFTETALTAHKREGLELAVRARWAALAVVAVLLPILNPTWSVLYYEVLLLVVAGIGWLQQRVGRVGRSRAELLFLFLDLAVMVFVLVYPNPFADFDWPTAAVYRFDNFTYLFIILALGTLSYSWRTIAAIGTWTGTLWFIALGLVWMFGASDAAMTEAVARALPAEPELAALLDPNSINFNIRLQEVVVFAIVAVTLSISVRRFNRLLLGNAALERERENLSRYFSPNVVDELSRNDEPLKQIRSHDVAVIFVDIEGFTSFAASRDPQEVIGTLREFHGQMERAVFAHGGTLDKFLGDGLMATFGTPLPAPDDMRRAYHCARAMLVIADAWNAARESRGEAPLGVRVGLHAGPVVLGDIGGNRLEFAVIGNTVNVASRLEALTRRTGAALLISDEVHRALPAEETEDLQRIDKQMIRGLEGARTVWALPQAERLSADNT